MALLFMCAHFAINLFVYDVPWARDLNPFVACVAQASMLIVALAILQRLLLPGHSLASELALNNGRLREVLGSLRWCIPLALAWTVAVLVSSSSSVLAPDWKLALLESFLLSSVAEELGFRAILLRILQRRYSTGAASVFSAILFGAVHLNRVFFAESSDQLWFAVARVLVSTGAGYFLAVAYTRCRYNLWVPILLHLGFNGVGLLAVREEPAGLLIALAGEAVTWAWIAVSTRRASPSQQGDPLGTARPAAA